MFLDKLFQKFNQNNEPGNAIYADRWNREIQKPVIRSSICTGEKVAGFKNLTTGKFEDIMLIRNNKDMQEFLDLYGVKQEEITEEW